MVIEMFLLAPIALIYISYLVSHGEPFFFDGGMVAVLFAISSGVVTATPLLLFHIGNRHLPLTLTGFLFYINPSMQLASAVWLYGEPLGMTSILAFGFIWAALIVQFVRLPLRKS
jgi:chloramphenicol-sensitive protein RarD